jgi:hypothetical protein
MMTRTWLIKMMALAIWMVCNSVSAQLNDPCGCNAGLVPEVMSSSSNSQVQLAYLKLIDQKQFDESKKSGGISGNYLGIISASADYSEFDKKRSELFSKTNFRLSASESQSLMFSTVKTDAWGACKKQCIQSQAGFNCDVSEETDNVVGASCSWRPENVSASRVVRIVANGKTLQPQDIAPFTMRSWQVDRDPKKDLLLTFTLDPGSSAPPIRIAAKPKDLPRPSAKPVQLGYCLGQGGQKDIQLWGPLGENCNGIPAWGPYLTTGKPQPDEICACRGKGGFQGVQLWGPKDEPCGGVTSWGNYDQQCEPMPAVTLCGCLGQGDIVGGHVLWGPKSEACAGMPPHWGKYESYCVAPH